MLSKGGKISFIQDGELIEKSLCSLLREALPETVSSSGVAKNLQLWNGDTLVSDTTLPSYMPATDEIDVYALLPVTKEPLHIRLTATSPTVGAITTVYDVIEIPESLSNRRSPQLPYSRTMLHIATVIALANHSEFSGKFVEWSKLYGFEMGETNFFGQMSQSFDRVDARPSYQLMTIRDEIDRAERLQQDIQNCTLTLREQLCANVSIFRGLLSKIINKFSIAESFRDISCKLREIEQKEQQWTGSRSNSPTLVRRICEDLACEESNTLRIFSAILNRDISNLNWFFEYDDELSLLIKNIEILRPHYPAAFIGVKKKILNDCVTVLQAITSWVRSVREHGEELLRFQEQFVKKPEREFISPLATFRYRVRDDLEKLRNQTVANSSLLTRLNIFDILSSHLAELETVGRCISDIGHNLVIVQSDLAHQSHVLSDLHTQELILNDKILSQNADCSPIKSIPFCYHQRISSEEILLNKVTSYFFPECSNPLPRSLLRKNLEDTNHVYQLTFRFSYTTR